MTDSLVMEPWQLAGAGVGGGFVVAMLIAILAGYVSAGRKTVDGVEIRVGAGGLLGGAFATLAHHPKAALLLVAIGAAGSSFADALALLVAQLGGSSYGALSLPGNILWMIVNAIIVFSWHRTVLKPEAEAVGFDVREASFVGIIGRSLLMGLILILTLVLFAIPFGAVGAYGAPPLAAVCIGLAIGVAATCVLVWWTPAVLSLPATALYQPQPGVLRMHQRGSGLGLALTAALSTAFLCFIGLVVGASSIADQVWRQVEPDAWLASFERSLQESIAPTSLTPWEFALFNVPVGILIGTYTVLCVSVVSIAYRRWILPEHKRRVPPAGAPAEGGDAPVNRI
jgi:hypothetical protein